MSEKTQDLITKELVICDAFGELRLKPILFEKNVEYGTNKIIDLLNDLQQENQQLKEREKLVTEHYNVMVRHAGNLEGKIIQLETNIDEAIEYIKHSWRLKFDQVYDTSKNLSGWEAEELLSILERGKE